MGLSAQMTRGHCRPHTVSQSQAVSASVSYLRRDKHDVVALALLLQLDDVEQLGIRL